MLKIIAYCFAFLLCVNLYAQSQKTLPIVVNGNVYNVKVQSLTDESYKISVSFLQQKFSLTKDDATISGTKEEITKTISEIVYLPNNASVIETKLTEIFTQVLLEDTLLQGSADVTVAPSTINFSVKGNYTYSSTGTLPTKFIFNKTQQTLPGTAGFSPNQFPKTFHNEFSTADQGNIKSVATLIFNDLDKLKSERKKEEAQEVINEKIRAIDFDKKEKAGNFVLKKEVNYYSTKRSGYPTKGRKFLKWLTLGAYGYDKDKAKPSVTTKNLIIDSIQIVLQEGTIRRIWIDGKDRSSNERIIFENKVPISVSGPGYYEKIKNRNYILSSSGHYVIIGEVLSFHPIFELYSDNIAPGDTVLSSIKFTADATTTIRLDKSSLRPLFRFTMYSDAIGVFGDKPNGLVQFEGKFQTRLNNRYLRNRSWVPFRKFEFSAIYSRFDSDFKRLPVAGRLNDKIYINNIDAFRFSPLQVNTKLNLIDLDSRNYSTDFNINFIGGGYTTNIIDSFPQTVTDTFFDVDGNASYFSKRNVYSNAPSTIGSIYWGLDVGFALRVNSRLNVLLGAQAFHTGLLSDTLYSEVGVSYKNAYKGVINPTDKFLERVIYSPSIKFSYSGKRSDFSDAFYVRLAFYDGFKNNNANRFGLIQFGYTVNVSAPKK